MGDSEKLFQQVEGKAQAFKIIMGQKGVVDMQTVFSLREDRETDFYLNNEWVQKVAGGYRLTETGLSVLDDENPMHIAAKNPDKGN